MPRQVAKHIEVLAIYDELKLVLKKTGDDRCEYVEGHDDHTVAKKVGVAVSSVASIRRAKFGRFTEASVEHRVRQVTGDLMGRMERMLTLQDKFSRDMDALQAKHDDLQKKHDLLCTQLSASRIADVRHLRIADPHERQPQPNGGAR